MSAKIRGAADSSASQSGYKVFCKIRAWLWGYVTISLEFLVLGKGYFSRVGSGCGEVEQMSHKGLFLICHKTKNT